MGKSTAGAQQFTTALKNSRGGVAGPLGNHLLLAAVNLAAKNLQDQAHQLDQSNEQEASKRRRQEQELGAKEAAVPAQRFASVPSPSSLPSTSCRASAAASPGPQRKQEELLVTRRIKTLRQRYVAWLASALPGKDFMEQSALLEDDHLANAWQAAAEGGNNPEDALQMALKCEFEPTPGPCCSIGPLGLQRLLELEGLDFGIVHLPELKRVRRFTQCPSGSKK